MTDVKNTAKFDEAADSLCVRLKDIAIGLSPQLKEQIQEIRLRLNQPLGITVAGKVMFLKFSGEITSDPAKAFMVDKNDIEDSIRSMARYSLHTHQHEIQNGYITLKGGHRAGICGTAVLADGVVTNLRNITSINLRISRQITHTADRIIDEVYKKGICGLLVVGPPASGKTTVLRDIARQLSYGFSGRTLKVVVVDERCEIAAQFEGISQHDLGPSCDIMSGYPKAEGMMQALRSLSPNVMICDEVGRDSEIQAVSDALNAGVSIISSIHASSLEELMRRPQAKKLIETGAFSKIVMLASASDPSKIISITGAGDLNVAHFGSDHGGGIVYAGREPGG